MRRLAIIGITTEQFWDGEEEAIEWLLENGLDRLHIRKPDATHDQIERLIQSIDRKLWGQLSLHDGFELTHHLSIGGVHLNNRHPQQPDFFSGKISRSCHSIVEVAEAKKTSVDYLFLSPIYNSISKQGYLPTCSAEQLQEASEGGVIDSKVIALGGVTPDRFAQISDLGFGGAALLGYLWGNRTIYEIKKRYELCYNSLHTEMLK